MTVFVSAIYGGYDSPKPAPPGKGYLFTDDPDIVAPGWEVIVDDRYPHLHPRLKAKAPKLQPHVFLPDEPVTTWVDGSMTLKPAAADIEPGLRFFRHPERDNVTEEAHVSTGMHKYAGLPVVLQASHYQASGLERGLWASGFHVRDITAPNVREFFDRWWAENLLWTYQDQLSLPYARQITGVDIVDIQWSLWSNPFFRLSEHNRGD